MKAIDFLGKLKKQKAIEPNARMNNMFVCYAMQQYAQAKCKEQREICCRNADSYIDNSRGKYKEIPRVYTGSILDAPEPDFE